MKQLDGVTDSMDMSLNKFWEIVKDGEAWRAAIHKVSKSWARKYIFADRAVCMDGLGIKKRHR